MASAAPCVLTATAAVFAGLLFLDSALHINLRRGSAKPSATESRGGGLRKEGALKKRPPKRSGFPHIK